MENVAEKTALITGASSGIGKELARIHARRGGDVVVVARSGEALQELKQELEEAFSVTVTVLTADLSVPGAASRVYAEVHARGIQVDYLINNAGFGGLGKFHERAMEVDLAMMQVNVVALVELTRLFLPEFVARNSGRILNVSSTASLMPGPLQAVYYATKAFVTSFSNALAEELYDTGVTVTALLPGPVKTKFGAVSGMDKAAIFRMAAEATDVAEGGYNAMLAGRLNVIPAVGFAFRLGMALLPFMPKRLLLRTVRKLQEVPASADS